MTCDICRRADCEVEYGSGSPSCYRIGYERLRASLSTAEKALTEAREEAVEAGAHAIRSELLVDELRRDRDEWRTQHENLLAIYQRLVADAAPAANKASDSSAMEKALGALRELLRLYDWRLELARRESDARFLDTGSDFWVETRRLLRQYGAEKKAAWAAARTVLSGGAHVDGPGPGDRAEKEGEG